MYSNVIIGKEEFAAVLGIGWTSVSVDVRNSKKVQAAIRLWKGGDTQGELKAKYQDESAASMCRLAEKLIKADKKKQLREASGMLPERSTKKMGHGVGKGKASLACKRVREEPPEASSSSAKRRKFEEKGKRFNAVGQKFKQGKVKGKMSTSASEDAEGTSDGMASDALDDTDSDEDVTESSGPDVVLDDTSSGDELEEAN